MDLFQQSNVSIPIKYSEAREMVSDGSSDLAEHPTETRVLVVTWPHETLLFSDDTPGL